MSWNCSLPLKLVERFPVIVDAGAGVLAFTAASMIVGEPLLARVFQEETARWAMYILTMAAVLGAGWWTRRRDGGGDDGRNGKGGQRVDQTS